MNGQSSHLLLNLTDLSSEPLHAQISRQVRARILANQLTDGQLLPSIRGMARQHRVSVITVQRAYDDLEKEGLIRSRRGKGFFVSEISKEKKQAMAEERFEEALTGLLDESLAEGLNPQQIEALFHDLVTKRGKR